MLRFGNGEVRKLCVCWHTSGARLGRIPSEGGRVVKVLTTSAGGQTGREGSDDLRGGLVAKVLRARWTGLGANDSRGARAELLQSDPRRPSVAQAHAPAAATHTRIAGVLHTGGAARAIPVKNSGWLRRGPHRAPDIAGVKRVRRAFSLNPSRARGRPDAPSPKRTDAPTATRPGHPYTSAASDRPRDAC